MNYKSNNLAEAKKQFLEDLHNDPDFLEFKKNCRIDGFPSYGCVISTQKAFLINTIGLSCESLIAQFKREGSLVGSIT